MQFIERVLPLEKLLSILELANDRTGYFELAAAMAYPNGDIIEYSYRVPVYLKEEVQVPDETNGWDGIICLQGETRAFSEYPSFERDSVWADNFKKIATHFK